MRRTPCVTSSFRVVMDAASLKRCRPFAAHRGRRRGFGVVMDERLHPPRHLNPVTFWGPIGWWTARLGTPRQLSGQCRLSRPHTRLPRFHTRVSGFHTRLPDGLCPPAAVQIRLPRVHARLPRGPCSSTAGPDSSAAVPNSSAAGPCSSTAGQYPSLAGQSSSTALQSSSAAGPCSSAALPSSSAAVQTSSAAEPTSSVGVAPDDIQADPIQADPPELPGPYAVFTPMTPPKTGGPFMEW